MRRERARIGCRSPSMHWIDICDNQPLYRECRASMFIKATRCRLRLHPNREMESSEKNFEALIEECYLARQPDQQGLLFLLHFSR